VRVIGGSARGRTLKSPPPPRASGRPGIRPTSDLIRGVIFDMLDALGADYARVLDLYAGTGALGIEALSRGDGTAEFFETDPAAVAAITANLEQLGMAARGRVHRRDARRAAETHVDAPFTLVLADPPYYDEDVFEAARAVAGSPLADDATVIVVEHRKQVEPPPALGRLPLYRSRRHGDTAVSIYAREDEP
jgi:16S rRNA (guanine(966)-N(2))-methyltransferase RsmD